MGVDEKIESTIKGIEKYIKKNLTDHRYSHSVRVAEMCVEIARLCGYDKKKAHLAGIAHDICKEVPKPKMVKMVEKSRYTVSDYEREHLTLLHGKAGAYFLEKEFGVTDSEILGAVAYHVSGTIDFGKLGKILYIADKNERGRKHITDEYLAWLYSKDLDEMFKIAYEINYKYMKDKNFTIFEDSYRILDALHIGR